MSSLVQPRLAVSTKAQELETATEILAEVFGSWPGDVEEMDDINWQTEIKQIVEKTIKEHKKQRILARAQGRWKDQVPNERGAAEMIREDRDAL